MGLDRTVLFKLVTSPAWEKSVRALPPAARLARRAATRYLAGDDLEDVLAVAADLRCSGVSASIDWFGELEVDRRRADGVVGEYERLARRLDPGSWLSVDLTHLGLDADPGACADRLAAIAGHLGEGQRIQVGAEDARRTEAVLGCVETVVRSRGPAALGATIPANLRRSVDDVDRLVDAGVQIRLVKGAYVEPAGVAHAYGEPTDLAFLRLARRLAERGASFSIATHDDVLREAVLAAWGPVPVEQLYGVRADRLPGLVARATPVRVYLPYGPNWFRYWMRRLAESRGA